MVEPTLDNRTPGSPGWWLSRLAIRLDARLPDMTRYADYYAGRHNLKFATQKWREAFGDLFSGVTDNFCEVVVDKLVERLEVTGFTFGTDQAAADRAWEIWNRNHLDDDFAKGIREGLTKGEFSLAVWAGGPNGLPRITVEDPLNVIVAVDPADTRVRRAALKRWTDLDDGKVYATLYLPDATYKYQAVIGEGDPRLDALTALYATRAAGLSWERREVPGEPWPLPNPLQAVPVVPFPNKPDLAGVGVSELRNITSLQDAINKLVSDMLLAAEFSAFRQKYAVNVELEEDPDTGRPIEPWKIAVDRLLTAPPPADPGSPEVRFGEFGQTDLGPYIQAIEMGLKHIAVISRMPPHYLLGGSAIFPSGESLRSAETGLVRKAMDRQRDLAEPLEEVQRLAFRILGDESLANVEAETKWADVETRTESEHMDALMKMRALGVPQKAVWEKIPATPTEIESWEALAEEEEEEARRKAEEAARLAASGSTITRGPNGEIMIQRTPQGRPAPAPAPETPED